MNELQRIDQDKSRAAHNILSQSHGVDAETRSRMRQLPARLRASGLAATYAFLRSKQGNEKAVERAYRDLVIGIAHHLRDLGLVDFPENQDDPGMILQQRFANANTGTYARMSAEVDELAIWLSRLADALHKEPELSGES
ncbi:type III-B CRISPR module-associated protein Cmr5 [Lipingzhangella sp. LS1_29]|uniref:CRISPR type III-B/RAMP module-associated protein Cmr5 n=1 Tax=Lipingzhangella rawalii TaxID=2055835 RepID=A0ABU2H334_9ACTN|nr:type III-B CRISPR module-associated protein Cmr5 [Lipingzhangella rawalii]MDS1269711.1 type III-B CRISPR module-associated protein Cmr5 [Lipingzhangella rawalii]